MPVPDEPVTETLPPRPGDGRAARLFVAVAGVAALGLAIAAAVAGPEALLAFGRAAWRGLQAAPAPLYFGAMVLGLAAPLPASVFYVTAGPLYGVGPSLAWIAPVLALNALLVHAIGTTTLRPTLERLVARRARTLPRLARREDQLLFATLVRVTPGIPYFIQSWAIVLAGVDRLPFVLISVGIQMIYATGFVVLGRAAFEGRLGGAVFALAFLVVAAIAARFAHGRLRRETP